MKYNIRRDGVVISMDFELGSGCYDKHGNEIFEGDFVLVESNGFGTAFSAVRFEHGKFLIDDYDLSQFKSRDIEIVEHVGD